MRFEPFLLERCLSNPCQYEPASAGIGKLRLREVTTEMDYYMTLKVPSSYMTLQHNALAQ